MVSHHPTSTFLLLVDHKYKGNQIGRIMGIIYQIRNILDDKVYIGSTKRRVGKGFSNRRGEHLHKLRKGVHHSKHLQNAFVNYGEKYFTFEVLLECSDDIIWIAEQDELDLYLINGRVDRKRCYNHSSKAFYLSTTKGMPLSKERKNRMKWTEDRKSLISKKFTGDGNPFYGKTHSREFSEMISKVHKGSKRTEECKQKMSEKRKGEKNGFYGKKHSDETRAKMCKAWTAERILRMITNNPNSKNKVMVDDIKESTISCK